MVTEYRAEAIERIRKQWSRAADEDRKAAIQFFSETYDRFADDKLADREFAKVLARGDGNVFEQRVAELLLASILWQAGFDLASADEGPDFTATKNGLAIRLELVTPEPKGVPAEYLTLPNVGDPVRVGRVPHAEIALRWANGLDEKIKKLLGNQAKGKAGYIERGVVANHEPYVIVINSTLLSPYSRDLNGISQFPIPVEICFGVGPLAMTFDRESGNTVKSGNTQRLHIPKTVDVGVPATTLLDERNAPVSGVLGINLHAGCLVGETPASVMLHNPYANNPVPEHHLPTESDWVCDIGDSHYTVRQA